MAELGRIYVVDDHDLALRIESVSIERETKTLIVLEEYITIPGLGRLGHGIVRRLSKRTDPICRTPRAALQLYLTLQRQKAEELRTELGAVEARVTEATMMLAEEEAHG